MKDEKGRPMTFWGGKSADKPAVEERPVCAACGQIDGEHLAHCRIAILESRLAAVEAERDAIRLATIEEAAKVCDAEHDHWRQVSHCEAEMNAAYNCANLIRHLKEKS